MPTENADNTENGEQSEQAPVGNWDWVTGKGYVEPDDGEPEALPPAPEPAPAQPEPEPTPTSSPLPATGTETPTPSPSQPDPLLRALPYVIPYGVFGLLTYAGDAVPWERSLIYVGKVFAVALALWAYRKAYVEFRPRLSRDMWVAALVGVLVIVAWVGLDKHYPQTATEMNQFVERGTRVFDHADKAKGAFNPYDPLEDFPPLLAIVFRMVGAVLVVPIFEELLLRSWLMRYVINERFWQVPMGAFTHASFWVGVGAMALTHHEWLAAMLCSAAFSWLLYWRKDIWLCIVAHAVANLALAVWVLSTGQWQFW